LAEEPKDIEKKSEETTEETKDIEKTEDQEQLSNDTKEQEEPQEEHIKEEKFEEKPQETADTENAEDQEQISDEAKEKEESTKEQIKEEKTEDVQISQEQKEKKGKPVKTEEKQPEKAKKKTKHDEDFKYIVRLSNTDIDGEKNVVYGLTGIKGIGMHLANLISEKSGIDQHKKIGDLSDSEIEKLQDLINSITDHAPTWMLNHRNDLETGEDIHLVGSEIDMRLRDEINIMKKIRSYRGIRHERGLRARGQRTKGNNRRGLALGVSKKREK
jgi:small subunit ribosomal protein S13